MRQNALEGLPIRSGSIEAGSDKDAQAGAGRNAVGAGHENALRAGPDLEKRFPLAIAMYVMLAVLVWFTMDAGKVNVFGKPVDLRLVPLIVIGGLALRTVLARQAERIRRAGEKGGF
jgi:hypothetical protein